ncbi:MAG: 2-oxoacid:acceptor oxidoreductase family protein [Bacillota bacterium]|nr:2-oxoacid:acceptor oxidoreductase family protein [Bacillota bacterium]
MQPNLIEVTVWYRGVVEGRLARQVTNSLADAAQAEGLHVQAFDNYTDLPDRVYVPCRSYARICPEPIAEPYTYVNSNPSLVVCTDAALVKGCNVLKGIEPGSTLLVNTFRHPQVILDLIKDLPQNTRLMKVATIDAGIAHQPNTPQGGIEGSTEKASTMRTAAVLLGAISKATGIVSLDTLTNKAPAAAEAISYGYEDVHELLNPNYDPEDTASEAAEFGRRLKVDLIVPAPEPNGVQEGHITGNYRLLRPVVDQQTCTACRICWISCPDACITVAGSKAGAGASGDANAGQTDDKISVDLRYCKGCGICWDICPLQCIKPTDELEFADGMVRITYSI